MIDGKMCNNKIFLCYSREDAMFARDLAELLRQQEVLVFLDTISLDGGDRWKNIIAENIENSSLFVVLVNEAMRDTAGYYDQEIRAALKHNKRRGSPRIIPALLGDIEFKDLKGRDEMKSLEQFQYIDGYDTRKPDILCDKLLRLSGINPLGHEHGIHDLLRECWISKKMIYPDMIKLITDATTSIDLYSVSACFGFYSAGMRVFESMLEALHGKRNTKGIEIRILVKIDNGSIDEFGAQRLASAVGKWRVKRLVNLGDEKQIQFVLIDGGTQKAKLLVTRVQHTAYHDLLAVYINRLTDGYIFSEGRNPEDHIGCHAELFRQRWEESVEIMPASEETGLLGLANHISKDFEPSEHWKNEDVAKTDLYYFLLGNFDVESLERLGDHLSSFRVKLPSGPFLSVLISLVYQPTDETLRHIEKRIAEEKRARESILEAGIYVVVSPKCDRKRLNDFKTNVDAGKPSKSAYLVTFVDSL